MVNSIFPHCCSWAAIPCSSSVMLTYSVMTFNASNRDCKEPGKESGQAHNQNKSSPLPTTPTSHEQTTRQHRGRASRTAPQKPTSHLRHPAVQQQQQQQQLRRQRPQACRPSMAGHPAKQERQRQRTSFGATNKPAIRLIRQITAAAAEEQNGGRTAHLSSLI